MGKEQNISLGVTTLLQELVDIREQLKTTGTKGLTDLMSTEDDLIDQLYDEGISMTQINAAIQKHGIKPSGKKITTKKYKTGSLSVRDFDFDDDGALIDTGGDYFASGKKAGTKYKPLARCAHSHPLLDFGEQSGTIQGGSCYTPQGTYDIEIMLCGGAKTPSTILPWETQYVRFPIQDQHPPSDKASFDKLIDWTIERMAEGKKVHVGCIGGHGRTGVFLSVLYQRITGEVDAITELRKRYCGKAVESQRQVDWLHKHYGIKKAKPRHMSVAAKSTATTKFDKDAARKVSFYKGGSETHLGVPAEKNQSIWGKTRII